MYVWYLIHSFTSPSSFSCCFFLAILGLGLCGRECGVSFLTAISSWSASQTQQVVLLILFSFSFSLLPPSLFLALPDTVAGLPGGRGNGDSHPTWAPSSLLQSSTSHLPGRHLPYVWSTEVIEMEKYPTHCLMTLLMKCSVLYVLSR